MVATTFRTLWGRLRGDAPSVFFLTRFPGGDDLRDGYYQRVASIDGLLTGVTRVYLHHDRSHRSLLPTVTEVAPGAFDVRCRTSNPLHLALLALLARRCDVVYAHSIYGVQKRRRWWLYRLGRRRILDVHGAVPEEQLLLRTPRAAALAALEARTLARADVVVTVTDAMGAHLRAKHAIPPDATELIRLPIFPSAERPADGPRVARSVVYCGGLQPWQQIEKMLGWVHAHRHECTFTFLVPDPAALRRRYAELHGGELPGMVASATGEEVRAHYARAAFGLVLREDVVVNRVACPTKLVEYLQHDLVPIVDSEEIGDFRALGTLAVRLGEPLPDEARRREMAVRNRRVLRELDAAFRSGADALRRSVAGGRP